MDTLNDISPYWLCDTTVSTARLTEMNTLVWGQATMDASLSHADPWSPLPVITDAGLGGEHPRMLAILHLPFPYLPAQVICREPGERLTTYRMRIILTLDMMGLLQSDEQGYPGFAPIDGAPADVTQAQAYMTAFDGEAACDDYQAVRSAMDERLTEAWPDGYPREDMIRLAGQLAILCANGSVVLAAHHALALFHTDNQDARRHAVDILKAMTAAYGDLFAPEGMNPDQVGKWVGEHKTNALDMADTLEQLELAPSGIRDIMEGVLS